MASFLIKLVIEKNNSNGCSARSMDQNSFSHDKIEFSGIFSHAVLIFFSLCHGAKKKFLRKTNPEL